MENTEKIQLGLGLYKKELQEHRLYRQLSSVHDIKIFMESHVYAVWDFMSLLKALQIQLTCVHTPWKPTKNTNTARFINEIVLEEESDRNEEGKFMSHFEMYLDAMNEVGANTKPVIEFLDTISTLEDIVERIEESSLNEAVKAFMQFTFGIIQSQEAHKVAAAFTFGREELIPDMFLEIIDQGENGKIDYPKLNYYLKRHIELDGDEHGPLSLRMIEELCGSDDNKWDDVLKISQEALQHRINLWDSIADEIKQNKIAKEVLA